MIPRLLPGSDLPTSRPIILLGRDPENWPWDAGRYRTYTDPSAHFASRQRESALHASHLVDGDDSTRAYNLLALRLNLNCNALRTARAVKPGSVLPKMRAAMRRDGTTSRQMVAVLLGVLVGVMGGGVSRGAEVSGVVRMPEICSPSVSPAVVYLTPVDPKVRATAPKPGMAHGGEVALVNQRGLQFTPRVQAIALGQTVRFTNQDGETHNVHVVSPGFAFNQSMTPGQSEDFTPERPGVMMLACDIHLHMRGFVVVSPTPWVQVCSRAGPVPARGRPRRPLRADRLARDGRAASARRSSSRAARPSRCPSSSCPARRPRLGRSGLATPVRPWAEVIDRIGMTLAASREAAKRPGELAKARRLAEDAYWAEFEASDMESAVRRHLGYRAGRRARAAVPPVPLRRSATWPSAGGPSSDLDDRSHNLLLDLVAAARELNAKGVTDAVARSTTSHVDARDGRAPVAGLAARSERPAGGPEASCSRPCGAGSIASARRPIANGPDEAVVRADHGLHDRLRAARAVPAGPEPAVGPAAGDRVQRAPRRDLRRASRASS